MNVDQPLLSVENLSVHFGHDAELVKAVDAVSFSVGRGETVALVGESGSGKSMSALSLMGLTPRAARIESGRVVFDGVSVLDLKGRELSKLRGNRISYIFQHPAMALNPVFKVGYQVGESVRLHRKRTNVKAEVARLLETVHLPVRVAEAYPHQISGGQQQRAMIAMALASEPDLLVADEPTTALDVTVQKEVLDLLKELRDRSSLSILLITHNFGVVSGMADRVYVMQRGNVVESGATQSVLNDPQHEYTQRLMDAIPRLG